MRTLVIGDIHGAYKALLQVLERSNYNPNNDTLIFLGDFVDGWGESFEVIEHLINLANEGKCIFLWGNHDIWFQNFIEYGFFPEYEHWLTQGGQTTVNSYSKEREDKLSLITEHREFLKFNLVNYHLDGNKIFVHGGYYDQQPIDKQQQWFLLWDRELWETAKQRNVLCKFKNGVVENPEVFIGHTHCVTNPKDCPPKNRNNVWNLDTGAGWHGKLTIMDVNTKEYWQSDLVQELYPEETEIRR